MIHLVLFQAEHFDSETHSSVDESFDAPDGVTPVKEDDKPGVLCRL